MKQKQEIIHIMPVRLRMKLEQILREQEDLEEIRIRIGQPVELCCQNKEIWLKECITEEDLEEMLTFISKYSIYAYEEEIRQGYLTIEGGNRIGFAGQVRMKDGQVLRMTNIRFLNIRIANEKKGCAVDLLPWIYRGGEIVNTLLISPPGIGKTTYLRDCIRLISDGAAGRAAKKVCIIDERSEIAACHLGVPQNDVGKRTDVIDGCLKREGMRMALRSMSPDIIAVDELGGREDGRAVEEMILCGCKILGTMHGESIRQVIQTAGMEELYQKKLFERYIFLRKTKDGKRACEIYDKECDRLC